MRPNRTNMRGGTAVKNRARTLRTEITDAERMLWHELRRHRLGWRFRRQFPIPPYIVDFACIEAKLIVEADGGQHAVPDEHKARDRSLRRQGWRVLRFWNNEILANRAGVLLTIADILGPPSKTLTPTLPRLRERGGTVATHATLSPPPRAGEG